MNLKKSEGKVGVDRECLLWDCLVVEGRVQGEKEMRFNNLLWTHIQNVAN